MANKLLTSDKIVTRALAVLHEVLTVPPNVNRQYSDEFSDTGAKSGDSIRIRKPTRFVAAEGAQAVFQDVDEDYATLTIAKQFNVPVEFTSKELTLSLDDFETVVLRPAMAALASKIDQYAFEVLNTGCGAVVLGSGANEAIKWSDLVKAGAYLDQNATPRDGNRSVLINPLTQANVLDETKGLFNAPSIAEQYREGVIGRTGGFLFTSASRAPVITLPATLTGTVSGSYTAGASTINLTGLAKSTQYPAGSVFTVANVYDVHPETKESLGRLHAFVVREKFTTDATNGDASGVSIFPVYATTGKQNVTALPSSGAAVTFVGTAGKSYRQTFAFHRDAFAFATVDMVLPAGASRKVMDGISMRYASDWDGEKDRHIKRFDVLCGIAPTCPELCVKLLEPNS